MMDSLPFTTAQPVVINACWKQIGISGDRSCPELAKHIHCRNCTVYSRAAATLRDHFELPDTDNKFGEGFGERAGFTATLQVISQRHVIFRIEHQWFAIPSSYLSEVTQPLTIRAVPYRHSTTLLGVCNVRGKLTPCISLHRLFSLPEPDPTQPQRRMMVLQHHSGPLITAVDQILAIELMEHSCWSQQSIQSGSLLGQLSKAVTQFKQISLTLLDADPLLQRMLKELQ